MPLMPKRVKRRKVQRGRNRGIAQSNNTVSFGQFGLQSLGRAAITNIQIEACRVAINRTLKRKGKVWIKIFPDRPDTKKPLEVRMGKGKGGVEGWAAAVKPGIVMFEIDGVPESIAREACRIAAAKLPIPTRFVQRQRHG
ncbi:MAG: 50S ribosomal protein L16 [Verrucomicrobiota bacterium]